MSDHILTRTVDEYQCSCGLCWDIRDDDPHQSGELSKEDREAQRQKAQRSIDEIKKNLND